MLPAPDGTPPIGVMVYPEWDVTYGYYFSVTNTSPSNQAFTFCALGDELLVPVYPDRLTNTMTAWECAYITEYYLNSSGVLASSVVDVVMPAGCHYLTFEPNFMFGFADPGQPTPHMVECGGTFPNLYLGTFGCNPGVPVNSPYPGSPNNIIGNGSGGNVPPINDGPTYVPPGPNPITMNPSPQNVNNITGPGDYPVQYPGQSPTSPNQNAFPSMIYPSSPGPMSIPPTPPELDPSPNPNTPPANAPCIFEQLYHWGTGM